MDCFHDGHCQPMEALAQVLRQRAQFLAAAQHLAGGTFRSRACQVLPLPPAPPVSAPPTPVLIYCLHATYGGRTVSLIGFVLVGCHQNDAKGENQVTVQCLAFSFSTVH